MAGITGAGTTFNLPNYTGELFSLTPQDTPILSAIGGLTGGKSIDATMWTWQTEDLRNADETRQRLEGADAPTAEARVRGVVRNVVEIHQEALTLSYTKQAATGQIGTNSSSHPYGAATQTGSNPVTDEVDHQLSLHIKQVARDIEKTFISGTFQEPANNSTARKTCGLIEAVSTNKVNCSDTPLVKSDVLDAMQLAYDNGGLQEDETRTLVCNSTQKRALTEQFIATSAGYQFQNKNVGGVNVQYIETDFGNLNIMLDRHMPADEVLILSLEDLSPVFLNIPGKGHFFVEELAKTGAADKYQLYGEIGLEYGNEKKHARIYNLGGYTS